MSKEEFVEQAKKGKILVRRCTKCSHPHLATVYFCQKCGAKNFENVVFGGSGSIATYTIITVRPAGFEEYTPYAWVILELDDVDLRVSGFMGGIKMPTDLPIGTLAKVTGFDDRGIIIEKVVEFIKKNCKVD